MWPANQGTTFCYKTTKEGLNLCFDVWSPNESPKVGGLTSTPSPVLVFFHGGGLTVGNKQSWLPDWIYDRLAPLGYLLISVDYRLLPPATGHDIVEDIKDFWRFITDPELILALPASDGSLSSFKVNLAAIAVGGTSAGGLCAYLAAVHCTSPKPTAILSMYGMCGDIFTSYYLSQKQEPFIHAKELLDPADYEEFLYPFTKGIPGEIASSPPAYHPETYRIPGYPANPRMQLPWLYLQLGIWLDYYTGEHNPSLSSTLRTVCGLDKPCSPSVLYAATEAARKTGAEHIPRKHYCLFPQFNVSSQWPPTVLVHGTADTGVPIAESEHLFHILKSAGVPVEIVRVKDQEHAFDYDVDAERKWKAEFDAAVDFLHRWTGGRSRG